MSIRCCCTRLSVIQEEGLFLLHQFTYFVRSSNQKKKTPTKQVKSEACNSNSNGQQPASPADLFGGKAPVEALIGLME
jgi:hypothetical protein